MRRWPFLGRDEERAALTAAVRDGGALLTGPHGVGKSALAAREFGGQDVHGSDVLRVPGSSPKVLPMPDNSPEVPPVYVCPEVPPVSGVCPEILWVSGTSPGVPLGAFAHLLPAGSPQANPLAWAASQLAGCRVLVVDDAHLLDDLSAALVHHLVACSGVSVVAVTRSEVALPAPVKALGLRRLEVAPLGADWAARLMAVALGGRVEGATARRFHRAAAGDLRFLRELVEAALAAGAVAQVDGVWCSRGQVVLSRRLRDLIRAEIGDLDDDERDVLELVAVHESIDADLLLAQSDADAVHRVERRGLITTHLRGRSLLVRLAHPMYQAVVRESVGPLRARHQIHRVIPSTPDHNPTPMTDREQQIGQLASWGLTNREIADWLGLSHRTVGNHLHRLYAKLGVNDRTHLAALLTFPTPPR
ncbi:helix-turn-helix transcriptional regulator [Acrocarpospora catenulata]|uniref:helix-turn-helix transcriptional regulator n=1 Tax=Acrocarpospora catenulata TaxID=2836182 RepID=UPI00202392C5|nr:LuxR C-terminal-related transcriptional regulator [Acrocarpospora catenulata]